MDGEEDLQLCLSLQTAEIDRHISSQLASSVTSRMDAEDVPSSPPKSGGRSWRSVFKRKRRSAERDENECGICRAAVSEEEEGETARKKLRLSKKQSAVLEESFKENNTLNPKQKVALAKELNLRPRQVEVWFQNRRARTKLKQTEVDYEFLKRCCDKLTEENRRLRQELLELQALNRSRHFKMPVPATTALTMCPTCERVEPSENQTALHSRHQIRL